MKKVGGYKYVADALILNPYKDRTHYHLIYGTRSLTGLLTFRKVEKRAMKEQHIIRCRTQRDRRLEKNGQLGLFNVEEIDGSNSYFAALRDYYLKKVKLEMREYLATKKRVEYDSLFDLSRKTYDL